MPAKSPQALAVSAASPLPFWHGIMWEPLPFAEVTEWEGEQHAVSMNDIIREQREKLRQLPLRYLPVLHGLRNNIDRMLSERLDKPHHRVFRVHWTRLREAITGRIEELGANKDLVEFEDNIQPFVLAHAAHSDSSAVEPGRTRELAMLDRIKGALGENARLQEDLVRSMLSRLWVKSHGGAGNRTQRQDICVTCNVPLTKSSREQMLVCPSCGFSVAYLDSTEAARTYGDEVEFTVTTSHRYNHWQEFVTRSQAREVKAVPRSTLAKIAVHMKLNHAVLRNEDITMAGVLQAVADLGLKDYKKNIIQIYARLTGKWPRQMVAEQMFVARGMFFEILNAFETLFPEEKWFRNKYCTSVICHTMGWEDMLDVFDANDALLGGPEAISANPAISAPGQATPTSHQMDCEKRMMTIFRHLGWVYRGPFAGGPEASRGVEA